MRNTLSGGIGRAKDTTVFSRSPSRELVTTYSEVAKGTLSNSTLEIEQFVTSRPSSEICNVESAGKEAGPTLVQVMSEGIR